MNIQCIRTTQAGRDIYVGVMSASTLIDRSAVDEWSPENPTGYQRALAARRISEVVHYLEDADGVFPSSVLLSYRAGGSRFDPDTANGITQSGTLMLPDDATLYVIDGQHRIAALRRANEDSGGRFGDYPVPFTLMLNPDVFDEARWFYLVNSKAKRVPVDLAEQLLAEAAKHKGEDWLRTSEAPETSSRGDTVVTQTRLVNLVNRLQEICPVWKGHIVLPGEKASSKEDVKAHTFITALSRGAVNDRSFARALENSPDELAQVLSNYWQAIAQRWPTAISNGKEYSLRGTQGLYSLHAIFPDVLEICREGRDYGVTNMVSILNNIEDGDELWSRDDEVGHPLAQSTSMAVLRKLARHLREQLPEVALPGF